MVVKWKAAAAGCAVIAVLAAGYFYGENTYNTGYSSGYDSGYSEGYSEGVADTKGKYAAPAYASNVTVYITMTGEKYHEKGCSYLSSSAIPINLEEAKAEGYTRCGRCHPPR